MRSVLFGVRAALIVGCVAVVIANAERAVAADKPKSNDPAKQLAEFMRELYRITTPQGALQAIDDFEATHELGPVQIESLKKQRERFRDLDRQKLVKLGNKWVKPEERNAAVEKSQAEIKLFLDAIRKGDGKEIQRHYKKATDLYPEGYEADHLMAMLFSVRGNCNPIIAEKHFEAVLNRAPDLPSILNNLALTEIKLRKFDEAYEHWKTALKLDPLSVEMVHNLGRAAGQAAPRGGLPMTAGRAKAMAELYESARDAAGLDEKQLRIGDGWLYSALIKSEAERVTEPPTEAAQPPASAPVSEAISNARPLLVSGWGSGFAIGTNLVLTNRHVVRHDARGLADAVTLQAFAGIDSPKLDGKVRAVSESYDLALIECPGLNAKPIAISEQPLQRGTELAVLGFPLGPKLGLSLKMTRGIVTALPEQKLEGMFFLDADSNPGNSGGPVCDARAHVIGILTAGTSPTGAEYSLAVPSLNAREFLNQHTIPFHTGDPADAERAWKDVDQAVSSSVYLIEVLYRAAPSQLAQCLPEKIRPKRSELEDPSCCSCNGHGSIRCTANGCAFGGTTLYEQYPTAIDMGERIGRVSTVATNIRRQKCSVCNGAGRVRCPECRGSGIGVDIR